MKNFMYLVFGLILMILAYTFSVSVPVDFTKFSWFAYAVLGWMLYHNQSKFWKSKGALFMSVFSCSTTPSRSCGDCIEEELNKVVHAAFVARGTSIDTSSIVDDLLTAELTGSAYIIRNVSGGYDGGKGSFGKGLGKQIKRLLGKAHTLTFIDFDYVSNAQFWADMELSASNYDLYFFTDTKGWVVANAYLSIEAQAPITDDNQTFIEGTIVVTWSKKNNPLNYDTNVDDLASCQQLFDGAALHFSNQSGSTATIITGTTDEIDMTRITTSLVAHLNTAISLESAEVLSGTLPTGLTLGVSGNYITLSGTTTQAIGSYTVIVKGSNAVGVSGQKTIKFVIA